MDINLLLAKAAAKAKQLGNPNYELFFHDYTLAANGVVSVEGATDYFYIIGSPATISVESKDALYDTGLAVATGYIQRMHEHQGDLKIINLSGVATTSIAFVQQVFAPKECSIGKEQNIDIEIINKTIINHS